MKFLKSKLFFIKSFFLLIILVGIATVYSLLYLEPTAYNNMVKQYAAENTGSDEIVIIAIDDKSISYHRWPWPRDYYAKMINFISEYSHAKVIGFDSIIASSDEKNPNSDKYFADTVKRTKNLVVGFAPITTTVYDETRTMNYLNKFQDKFGIKTTITEPLMYNFEFPSISEYPDWYFSSVKNAGSVFNAKHKDTQTVTQMSQIVNINGHYYPSLALKMYMLINDADEITISPYNVKVNKTGLIIPATTTNSGTQNLLRYYHARPNSEYTHKKYSASDIIKSYELIKEGKKPIINPREFDGKIVFIGANAKAAALGLEDAMPTPIQSNHPGVDIQATNMDNLLNGEFMYFYSISKDFITIVLATALTFLVIWKCSFSIAIILLLLLAFGYFVFAAFCYRQGYAICITIPYAIELVTAVFGYSYRFILEGKTKEKIKQAMGKYLSQDIMKNVVQNIDDIKLGGKRANVTVLFADIRGFTSMSEKMSAEEVSKILNEYFTEIEPIITMHNGVINKFIGDAVMAIFGEPIQDAEHPQNAVKCADAMLHKVKELQEKWLFEGKPKIEIGIGICTGEVFVGNIGSEKRLEYTVIGDTVNLASRIEGFNKVYHTNLLISSSTYSYVSDMAYVIKISDVSIRGKAKKMDIYEILRLNAPDEKKQI